MANKISMHTDTMRNFSSISFMQISLCPLSTVPGRREYYSLLNPTSHIWLGNICSPAGDMTLNTKGDNYIPLLGLARDEGPLYCSRPWPLCVPVYLQVGNNDKGTLCDVTLLTLNYPCRLLFRSSKHFAVVELQQNEANYSFLLAHAVTADTRRRAA